jgi:flagellar biosynthesis protein FliP
LNRNLFLRCIALGVLVVLVGWRLAAADETAAGDASVAQETDAPGSPYIDPAPAADAEPAVAPEAVAPEPVTPEPVTPETATANEPAAVASPGQAARLEFPFGLGGPDEWTSPEGLSSTLKMLLLLTVVSLAPAVLLMTTCFVRIVVVLGLLRQALGTGQLPSSQVVTSIALFMTLLIMWPVWNKVYTDAIVPYTSHEITLEQAWDSGVKPVRGFMSAQIERTGNSNDVWLFYKYLPEGTPSPTSYDDVPLVALLPAFMLSELKTAFLIGFQIYLPFLVVDLVVASVTISMGMVMLPPVLVSLPLKLLLFVLVDGWHLVVGMLLESFQAFA